MGIIVNFPARTVNGLGGDWRGAIPIHTITDTAITFFAERQNDSVEASIIGTIDRITGDVDAGIKVSGSSGKVSILYSLKCKPGAWGWVPTWPAAPFIRRSCRLALNAQRSAFVSYCLVRQFAELN